MERNPAGGGGVASLPPLMTPRQLAAATGQNVGSITRGIREGRIPADKLNGRWYVSRDRVFPNAMGGAGDDRDDER